ncbi:multicopper oxidase domain-containing protein [Mesorhizobium sp.]|uniref:multicopper oxidase family protein n=1 Tax=Mesorhizobium sp. TaxID=1871066 RepID=UPI000FE532B5|nr:multicopper oxidase domain-containing protein [Mesorhizobium sp.]RWK43723.1 MAG: twin-arginine translocation signal domain-containing protein [Mesorhizobium sp.]
MPHLSRRRFLTSCAAAGAAAASGSLLMPARPAFATPATLIRAGTRTIDVNGRAATVYGLMQTNGMHGLIAEAGRPFHVRMENGLDEETLIHWHGLTPPWQQDGVPGVSQALLSPGAAHNYDFLLKQAGTNWMHAHHGLQEQGLLAAPLIVRDPAEAREDVQEVVVLFHDFTFRDPAEVLAGLQAVGHGAQAQAPAMDHGAMGHAAMGGASAPAAGGKHGGHDGGGQGAAAPAHLNDVEYDAFLANDRTLDDPEVFRVERGGRVRLRLINGAAATNFWIDLGGLEGQLIAVDGMPVEPIRGRRFEFAIAQRLDIALDLPKNEGAWPIFAVREGERTRTGFILATSTGLVERAGGEADEATADVGLALEVKLRAVQPLPELPADREHMVTITEAPGYVWMLNGKMHGEDTPLSVAEGERIEITFRDQSTMAHPMHLHGHHFQVVAINGKRFQGAVRDTVLVPSQGSVTVAFDAVNPGKWALHCHHLYHMIGGMMTTIEY